MTRGALTSFYADPPIVRVCRCDRPAFRTDEDGDTFCRKCGRPDSLPVPSLFLDHQKARR